MGYSHYWDHSGFTDEEWTEFTKRVTKVYNRSDVAGHLDITHDYVVIVGECETFVMSKYPVEFGCCKTRRYSYDTSVVVCLMIANDVNENFRWDTDGSAYDGDFDYALSLYNKTFPVTDGVPLMSLKTEANNSMDKTERSKLRGLSITLQDLRNLQSSDAEWGWLTMMISPHDFDEEFVREFADRISWSMVMKRPMLLAQLSEEFIVEMKMKGFL